MGGEVVGVPTGVLLEDDVPEEGGVRGVMRLPDRDFFLPKRILDPRFIRDPFFFFFFFDSSESLRVLLLLVVLLPPVGGLSSLSGDEMTLF